MPARWSEHNNKDQQNVLHISLTHSLVINNSTHQLYRFKFNSQDNVVMHGGSGKCLTHDGKFLQLLPCDMTDDRFKWKFAGELWLQESVNNVNEHKISKIRLKLNRLHYWMQMVVIVSVERWQKAPVKLCFLN